MRIVFALFAMHAHVTRVATQGCPHSRTWRCLSCATVFPSSMVPDSLVTVTLLSLAAPDATAARALADTALGDAPYAELLLASLDGALTAASDEYRAIVARDESVLLGLIVFGETAGAVGAGRIYFVVVDPAARRRGIATALVDAACRDLRARGARLVAMELTEDPRLERGRWLAHRAGFREEARVSDYVREGVGLVLLRRDLEDGTTA